MTTYSVGHLRRERALSEYWLPASCTWLSATLLHRTTELLYNVFNTARSSPLHCAKFQRIALLVPTRSIFVFSTAALNHVERLATHAVCVLGSCLHVATSVGEIPAVWRNLTSSLCPNCATNWPTKISTVHTIKQIWRKASCSTHLHVSVLQCHLQGMLTVPTETMALQSGFVSKWAELFHAVRGKHTEYYKTCDTSAGIRV